MRVYKYRNNKLDVYGKVRQDTLSLINDEFYVPSFKELNDPFEALIQYPEDIKCSNLRAQMEQRIHTAGVYAMSLPERNENFPGNELLWAHYSDAHKGFCIEYEIDEQKLHSIPGFKFQTRIDYVTTPPLVYLDEPYPYIDLQKSILGTKSVKWKYENEYRFIIQRRGVKKYTECPAIKIKAIYFGVKMDKTERSVIIHGLKTKHPDILFYQMQQVAGSYMLQAGLPD